MNLDLNDEKDIQLNKSIIDKLVEPGKLFSKTKSYEIPILRREGRFIAGIDYFMEKRLNETESKYQFFNKNLFTTNMVILSTRESTKFQFIINPTFLYSIYSETLPGSDGYLNITEDQYEDIIRQSKGDFFELSREEGQKLKNRSYSVPKTREAFWEFAAKGNTQLRDDYMKMVKSKTRLEFKSIMDIWHPHSPNDMDDSPHELNIINLGAVDKDHRSNAYCRSSINSPGRIVGMPLAKSQLDSDRVYESTKQFVAETNQDRYKSTLIELLD